MPLTDQQRDAVQALDWLYSPGGRRTGRTFAQAVALIRMAARFPGQKVTLVDHAQTLGAQRHITEHTRDIVERLVQADPEISTHFQVREMSFWFSPEMPRIEDWWPDQEINLPNGVVEAELENLFQQVSESNNPPAEPEPPKVYPSRWSYY